MDTRTRSAPRRPAGLLTLLFMGAMLALPPAATLGADAPDLLPDLRMLKPRDVQVVKYTSGPFSGRRFLRFTTIISNEGVGPLELRGKRDCTSLDTCPSMTVRQRVKRSDGSWRSMATTAIMQYEVGDGHHHWHVVGMEGYRLWPLGVADPTPLVAAKFGYCFFDGTRLKAGAANKPHYLELGPASNPGCGTFMSLKTLVGLTPGWADTYPWNLAGQYIDITGVPTGEYLLCIRADPKQRFLQASTTNDEAWVRLRIAGTTINIRESRRTSCTAERAQWAPDDAQALTGAGEGDRGRLD